MEIVQILTIFATLMIGQALGKQHSLICPIDYAAKGQSWYVEYPNNKPTDIHPPNLIEELILPTPTFKPTTFSICVICTCVSSKYLQEVELCVGHETLQKKTNLAYEGGSTLSGDHKGTLVWSNVSKPVGLTIDMSKGDLLSTLQDIKAITNSSLQPLFLNCPSGFQLDRFEARNTKAKQYNTPCIICFSAGLLFSSCHIKTSISYEHSLNIPTFPIFGHPCPWEFQPGPNGCLQNVKDVDKSNQIACGTYLSAHNLAKRIQDLKAEYIRLDCPNLSDPSYSLASLIPSCSLLLLLIIISVFLVISRLKSLKQQQEIQYLQNHISACKNDKSPY